MRETQTHICEIGAGMQEIFEENTIIVKRLTEANSIVEKLWRETLGQQQR